jgi:hypothetical protein
VEFRACGLTQPLHSLEVALVKPERHRVDQLPVLVGPWMRRRPREAADRRLQAAELLGDLVRDLLGLALDVGRAPLLPRDIGTPTYVPERPRVESEVLGCKGESLSLARGRDYPFARCRALFDQPVRSWMAPVMRSISPAMSQRLTMSSARTVPFAASRFWSSRFG